jgi:hypothetical protein
VTASPFPLGTPTPVATTVSSPTATITPVPSFTGTEVTPDASLTQTPSTSTPPHTSTFVSTVTPTATQSVPTVSMTLEPTHTSIVNMLLNGSFETGSRIPDYWTAKGVTSDRRRCNKTGKPPMSYEGECVYQFKGGLDENSKLKQKVDLSSMTFNIGDKISMKGVYSAKGQVDAKVKVRIKYIDANLQPDIIIIEIVAPTDEYVVFKSEQGIGLQGEVKVIKVQIHNRAIRKDLV